MMAVMFVASATAFAGDSDALKAILKAGLQQACRPRLRGFQRSERYHNRESGQQADG